MTVISRTSFQMVDGSINEIQAEIIYWHWASLLLSSVLFDFKSPDFCHIVLKSIPFFLFPDSLIAVTNFTSATYVPEVRVILDETYTLLLHFGSPGLRIFIVGNWVSSQNYILHSFWFGLVSHFILLSDKKWGNPRQVFREDLSLNEKLSKIP